MSNEQLDNLTRRILGATRAEAMAERIAAGEPIAEVADDFGLSVEALRAECVTHCNVTSGVPVRAMAGLPRFDYWNGPGIVVFLDLTTGETLACDRAAFENNFRAAAGSAPPAAVTGAGGAVEQKQGSEKRC